MYLTFPNFIISDDVPVNGDLRIQLNPLTEENWEIPNAICGGTTLHDQDLDHFGTRLDMVNGVLRGRVMTCVQKKLQLNKLKQALGQNTRKRLLNNNSFNMCGIFLILLIIILTRCVIFLLPSRAIPLVWRTIQRARTNLIFILMVSPITIHVVVFLIKC